MSQESYRIAIVKFDGSQNEYSYLCDDESISANDLVFVEGQTKPVCVAQIKYVTKDNSAYPVYMMKNVLKKASVGDLNKTEEKPDDDAKKDATASKKDGTDKSEESQKKDSEHFNIERKYDIEALKNFKGIKAIANVGLEFSYADYHTDCLMKIKDDVHTTSYSMIRNIIILNHTDNTYSNLVVKISFSNDAFSMNDIRVKEMDGYEESELRVPFLKVNKQYLETLTERESASVKITLMSDDNIISEESYDFMVLPISQPSINVVADERLYAKYVTPLASKVKQVALNASKHNDNDPITTYQHKGANKYNDMLKEAQALYLALHDWGIAYQNPPAGGLFTQRIRMPEEVLRDKKGTCLDLAILYCACLEEVGFNSILVLIDGHAFAGFFLEEHSGFPNSIEYQCGKVYNAASGGMNNIVLVECVDFIATSDHSFQQAMKHGLANIRKYEGKVFAAVDIHSAHKGIFMPIPIQGEDVELELLIAPKEIESEELDSIVETKFVDVLRQEEKDRFTFWERKLLDLTEANPLVSFKLKTSNCLKFTSDSKIHELLAKEDSIKFACLSPVDNANVTESIEKEFLKGTTKPSDLWTNFDADKLLAIGYEKTLKKLVKVSNAAMDETGAPTLYLCMGILTYTRKKGHTKGHAPFMVLPIKITKDKMGVYYTISYDYDDVMINQTFFEYYKQEHPGVDFGELYQVSASDKYMDIVHTFKANNTEDIQLDEESFFVANLTFAHYIMWQDVRKRKEELKKNKVIQSILENRNVLGDSNEDSNEPIDKIEQYHKFAAPLYYDSTQLKAILKCGRGESFILDGPPGTGKSQTIVNMIVNAFYHGKTVLFVAEKKAALDVVADRLRKLGDSKTENNLGRFCLELHSNKANKAEFFEKLKTSMELGMTKNPEEFAQKCKELEQKRDAVLQTINKMHQRKYFYTLYDAIVKQGELSKYDTSIDFDENYLLELNAEKNQKIYDLIDTYIASASHIDNFDTNPLKVLRIDDVNFYDKTTLLPAFNSALTSLLDFVESYRGLVGGFDIQFDENSRVISAILDTLDLCFNKQLYVEALSEYMSNPNDDLSVEIFDATSKYLEIKEKCKGIFKFDLLKDVDANLALDELKTTKGFFKKLKIKSKWKKILKSVILPSHKLNNKDLTGYFQDIAGYNPLQEFIGKHNSFMSKMIGKDYFEQIEKIDFIKEVYFNTRKFVSNIKQLSEGKDFMKISTMFVNFYATKNPAVKMMYSLVADKFGSYKKLEQALCDRCKIDYANYSDIANDLEKFIYLLNYASNEEHFNELIDISQINRISFLLEELGLSKLLGAVVQEKVKYSHIREVFDLSCVNGYIKMYFKDDEINFFNPATFDAEVKKYKSLINEYNNLVVACVSAKLTENLNHNNINYANSSPIGRLKKSISSNGRGVSIRDTLLNYDDIIKKYFPCFLMSPLSAAQYLAVDENGGRSVSKFDLVIFDEASQIPTHEAVGPIARGKSLIVAGDPEQMPPSAYFSAGLELAEDEVQYDDAISLLDECIAIELPRIRLSYHYRSKHESLISFSNQNFYNGNLYTFPSPNTANSFVEFNYVELKENKKDSGITKEELESICNKFKDIYTNPKTCEKSVGIIVFNMKQQEKVFDAITDLLAKDKDLNKTIEKAVEKTKEPWFVKSLENVQGDERDIIILSVGFRKNSAGRAVVVGPIARENGQRRLNVAVSRSKEKMIVISTIKYTDFDEDNKIKNKGQLLLKQFLKFADENTFRASGGLDSDRGTITAFIKKDLEDKGYVVVPNVGNSEYRVDLAIQNKAGDMYDLGILIDSKELGQDISCRDKLYVQDSVLNALKWKIINIYSLEYFKDKKGTINKIIDAIDEPYVREEFSINAHIEKAQVPAFSYNSTEYKKTKSTTFVNYDNDYGYDGRLKGLLNEIIKTESPVAFETIKARVREYSNIQSMSSKARARLEIALKSMGFAMTADQQQMVYWHPTSAKDMDKFRVNSDRDIYDIPKEEILCAMKQILAVQGQISNEDLFRCTLEAFGYGQAVLSKKNQDRLEYVYNWAKSKGKLK